MYTAYFEPEYSGAALQALTLARELRRRGHHVEFVTNRWPGLADTAVVDGFQVQRLEPGRLRKHREFRLWLNLARYVWARRSDFDILHSHGAYYTHAFIGPLARLLGLKSLVKASLARDDLLGLARRGRRRPASLHAAPHRRLRGHQQGPGAGVPRAAESARPESTISQRRRHRALPRHCRHDQVHALRTELGLPTDQPIALYVGVLDPRKNILWLAEQWVAHDAFGTGALLLAVGPQGRDDPEGAASRSLGRVGKHAPAAVRAARLPRRRDALLPVRESAGTAFDTGKACPTWCSRRWPAACPAWQHAPAAAAS